MKKNLLINNNKIKINNKMMGQMMKIQTQIYKLKKSNTGIIKTFNNLEKLNLIKKKTIKRIFNNNNNKRNLQKKIKRQIVQLLMKILLN